jgi:hypothetical protein
VLFENTAENKLEFKEFIYCCDHLHPSVVIHALLKLNDVLNIQIRHRLPLGV